MTTPRRASVFTGFPSEVTPVAVRCYRRYNRFLRDVGDYVAEGGITTDHVAV